MALIPTAFTQRGVLGGDARSVAMSMSSLTLGAMSSFSMGRAVLVAAVVRKGGRLRGWVIP